MDTARMLTAKALIKMERAKSYSNLTLDRLLSQSGLSSQDRAFAAALFYGVLERMLTLDAVIASRAKTPLPQMRPEVRAILRCGLYQLLYMDTVPESAAVNESVALAKAMGQGRAAGFVNALLRGFIREGKPLPLPDRGKDPVGYLSVAYASPRWLIKLWNKSYGEDKCEGLLRSSLGRPPLYARANTQKLTAEALAARLHEAGVGARALPHVPGALQLEGVGEVRELDAFKEGLFHIQDLSSQLCAMALAPKPGERVYDLCAAPGGKTFTLAQLMEDAGNLTAFDIHPHKVALIEDGAKRLGLRSVRAALGDASVYDEALPQADRVLCDVPCSGLGIIRRKPEIKYKRPEELSALPDIQYKILQNAANYVKAGGILLYSTCALSPAENEENVRRFLSEHPDFSPQALPEVFDRLFPGRAQAHQLTIFPEDIGSDGFFLATLRKER
ncbi:16S rRNA (cytosine(967)-C(5))-methyltransferase RsmB [Zongyangia hominis]|uniref:16S rRNA (cytosine(967)-C(5))-methyltransferase n=1 Tax=Zongyangia hominis TaxID=2763677 RepID=A0A926EBT2_9FIRM|nr:16S rRNA (cytosine(967)-C(5))-methyltransferase RsmB [Zongyangia hominis]MBC8570913.1 16S rRNA (cytosine(967)-C(5))-methyltransferase RsmB [Zongyangia hominis]